MFVQENTKSNQKLSIMKRTLLSFVAVLALTFVTYAQWTEQASGFATASRGIQDICTVDANIVWAVAYDGASPTSPCVDYTKTVNGGALWTAGTVTPAVGTSIANITAIDENNAWTIHYYQSGSGTLDGVYHTSDGGATWTHQTTATFSNANSFPDCIWFWDVNNGYCMGDPINNDFEIYTTTDGGTTWVQVPGANIPNNLSGEYGVVGYQSIVGDNVWFGTNKGRIYKSTDKGLNWTVSAITGWSAKYVEPRFKDAMNGLAQDKSENTTGALVETSDGGETWTAITATGNTFTNDYAYVPGTPNTYVSTGADVDNDAAGVTYSFDGGHTWLDMTATLGTQFLATGWVNDSTGWAGGFNEDASTGGMYKFDGKLAEPIADFMTADTALTLGGQAHFTNLSTGSPTTFTWTFDGGVPGSSTLKNPPAVLYNTPGDFDVTLAVTSDFGTNTTVKAGYIHVGGVGISNQTKSTIMIFPNPATDFVSIQSNDNIVEVQLFNLIGQEVITKSVDSKKISLNISSLTTGVYTLKIVMNDGYINKKIVVK
jgi:photosystem II stability/assembly factor-like uncharacterized protein